MQSGKKDKSQQAFDNIVDYDLSSHSVSVCLASTESPDKLPDYRHLQLSNDLATDFREAATRVLERMWKWKENGDLRIIPYNAGNKPDSHDVEYIDLSEQETIRDQIAALDHPISMHLFDASNADHVERLRFYSITLMRADEKPIHCFRFYTPRMEIKRSPKFAAVFSKGHYDRLRKPVFLFDRGIDCVAQGDHLYIFKKDNTQKLFRFFEMVEATAKKTLQTIKSRIPIAGFDYFEAACESHHQKLAKLKNIASKPYLKRVTIDDLKLVIKKFGLPVKVVKENGVEKIQFDHKDKWAILRLLDDDYLESLMTGTHYEVTGKRPI